MTTVRFPLPHICIICGALMRERVSINADGDKMRRAECEDCGTVSIHPANHQNAGPSSQGSSPRPYAGEVAA